MAAPRFGPILIVDDEPDLRDLVDFNLRQAGYATLHAGRGDEALERAFADRPALVILDLNLPDIAGTEVARRLRADERTRATPILMLTARGTDTDRIVGFELGADDYVTKPFNVRELVLRVDALRRRVAGDVVAPPTTVLSRGDLVVDRKAFTCTAAGVDVALTPTEFRLLSYLLEAPGTVRTREDLLANVWNASPEMETRTIDTHIRRLREKLGPTGELIETVRGIGYVIR